MLFAKHLYLFTLCSPSAVMFFIRFVGRGFKFTVLISIPASVLMYGEIFRKSRLPIDERRGQDQSRGGGIREGGRNDEVK